MVYRRYKPPEGPIRVRMPRGDEVIGCIEGILGASRFRVDCLDGKTRICRIPGKFRKRIKVRPGDWLIVKPWSIEPESRGDVIWIYTRTQANWLHKRGYLEKTE